VSTYSAHLGGIQTWDERIQLANEEPFYFSMARAMKFSEKSRNQNIHPLLHLSVLFILSHVIQRKRKINIPPIFLHCHALLIIILGSSPEVDDVSNQSSSSSSTSSSSASLGAAPPFTAFTLAAGTDSSALSSSSSSPFSSSASSSSSSSSAARAFLGTAAAGVGAVLRFLVGGAVSNIVC